MAPSRRSKGDVHPNPMPISTAFCRPMKSTGVSLSRLHLRRGLISRSAKKSAVVADLDLFKSECDVILTNRMLDELNDVADKVFARELLGQS